MAEEWGTVVFKANKEITNLFLGSEQSLGLKKISNYCDNSIAGIDDRNLDADSLDLEKGYIHFSFYGSDWLDVSLHIVKYGKNVEWYSRISDEYGCLYFYAINADGEKVGFSVETGGDYCEIEGYEEESLEKIENWKSKLPQQVKSTFPDFVDTNGINFDGP